MVIDQRRIEPYIEALKRTVKPGDVVLDIGTGTGFLAFLAIQLGARKVFAVEPDDAILVGQQCARANAGSDRITWLQQLSTEITLPEPADVVVGDLHGVLPLYTGNIESLRDARRRHLKPGGAMIPCRDILKVVPATAADEFKRVNHPWRSNVEGIALQNGRNYVANMWWRAASNAVPATQLLAEPGVWTTVDYNRAEDEDTEGKISWRIERAGTMHGFYVWFDSIVAPGLEQTNSPLLPAMIYGRAFFPIAEAIEVSPTDEVHVRMAAPVVGGERIFVWDTRIIGPDEALKAEFHQSTFHSRPINQNTLRRSRAEFVPTLNELGAIDGMVIAAMGQGKPLGEIAANLASRFPKRFANERSALDHATKLSLRYCD